VFTLIAQPNEVIKARDEVIKAHALLEDIRLEAERAKIRMEVAGPPFD
jgi:hypothetical protein